MRLPGGADRDAWERFVAVYAPFLHRYARRRGVDEASAGDLVQQILLRVHRGVASWEPRVDGPRFRNWLMTVARNQTITFRRQLERQRAIGGSAAQLALDAAVAPHDESADEREYRREVLLWAAAQVRGDVQPQTWQAFWLTAVEGRPCSEVAAELALPIGSVYAARSRLMKRIRDQIEALTEVSHDL